MGGKEGEFVGEGRKELGGWREVVEGGRCLCHGTKQALLCTVLMSAMFDYSCCHKFRAEQKFRAIDFACLFPTLKIKNIIFLF